MLSWISNPEFRLVKFRIRIETSWNHAQTYGVLLRPIGTLHVRMQYIHLTFSNEQCPCCLLVKWLLLSIKVYLVNVLRCTHRHITTHQIIRYLLAILLSYSTYLLSLKYIPTYQVKVSKALVWISWKISLQRIKMRNVALLEMGARLSQASSHHSDYPASGIIDKYAEAQQGWI